MASDRPDLTWPLYFAKRPLAAKRLTLKKGDVFPLQDKAAIKGLAAAYGVPHPERVRFSELDYVDTLNVRTEETARYILDRGLSFDAARKLVQPARDAA